MSGDIRDKYSEFTGNFYKTEMILHGKFVFKNGNGKYLFSTIEGIFV